MAQGAMTKGEYLWRGVTFIAGRWFQNRRLAQNLGFLSSDKLSRDRGKVIGKGVRKRCTG